MPRFNIRKRQHQNASWTGGAGPAEAVSQKQGSGANAQDTNIGQ